MQPAEKVAGSVIKPTNGWLANLSLKLVRRKQDGKTVLARTEHQGPLRVQRAFYPEGGVCHLYLLHPPGGMVTGDSLQIRVEAENASQTVITTPSAGKIYRGDNSLCPQQQTVQLHLAREAFVEWLPQETIIFNGARGEVSTVIDMDEGSQGLFWDVVCLGRPASGELFEKGYLTQKFLLSRKGQTIYRERNVFKGGDDLLRQPWGLNNFPVTGTCVASCELQEELVDSIRSHINQLSLKGMLSVSQLQACFVARYLGPSAEECRKGFEEIRNHIRPVLNGVLSTGSVSRPRIWNT